MDEAARNALPRALARALRGRSDARRASTRTSATASPTAGIEYYLPLFFDETATVFDYLGAARDARAARRARRRRCSASGPTRASATASSSTTASGPILPPEALFLQAPRSSSRARKRARAAARCAASATTAAPWASAAARPQRRPRRDRAAGKRLQDHVARDAAPRPDRRRERRPAREPARAAARQPDRAAERRLRWPSSRPATRRFAITVAPLAQGFAGSSRWHGRHRDDRVRHRDRAVRDRAGARRRRRAGAGERRRRADQGPVGARSVGDPVVHVSHGIGRYLGLTSHRPRAKAPSEFLHLEYADKATLYVPVAQLHLISRYTGVSADEAPLHKLGSGQWDKARRKAAEQVRDTAAELLNLYARRAAREGHAFRFQPHDYEAFAASFGFEETPDQHAAIHAVIQDMIVAAADGPPRLRRRRLRQDRGRAARRVRRRAPAASRSRSSRRRRCSPSSTTRTFADRFGKWPVQGRRAVALPHRQGSQGGARGPRRRHDRHRRRHAQAALGGRASSSASACSIIDEEHRFGVRHKEAMKALRAEVDVLTLTATPIPRTLGMALEGPARSLGDRHRAAAAPGDQDLRAQRRQRA